MAMEALSLRVSRPAPRGAFLLSARSEQSLRPAGALLTMSFGSWRDDLPTFVLALCGPGRVRPSLFGLSFFNPSPCLSVLPVFLPSARVFLGLGDSDISAFLIPFPAGLSLAFAFLPSLAAAGLAFASGFAGPFSALC